MGHLPDELGLLELLDFLYDELMLLWRLAAYLLLDGASAKAHRQVVLNHLPRDVGHI